MRLLKLFALTSLLSFAACGGAELTDEVEGAQYTVEKKMPISIRIGSCVYLPDSGDQSDEAKSCRNDGGGWYSGSCGGMCWGRDPSRIPVS